jgi:transcriptional regulator
MHAHPKFQWKDEAAIRAFVAEKSFGTLILVTAEGARIAQVPAVWMGDRQLGVHLSRANALVPHLDGARCLFVVQGADGYISPDWYGPDDQVPTWNYVSAELEGVARVTDDLGLMTIVDALSWEHERRLVPKAPWTRAKMSDGLFEKMCRAIIGYTIDVDVVRGTRKLGQNKTEQVRLAAADGLAGAGDLALAALMRGAGN